MELLLILQILTDEKVFNYTIWAIGTLGTGLLATLVYIFNQRVKQSDAIATKLEEFTLELKHKFRALNNLAKEFDTTKALHGKDLETLKNDHKQFHFDLRSVAKQAIEHEVEIRALKKYNSL